MPAGYAPPPPQLVEDGHTHLGRFDGPLARANLLDARYHGLPRPLRWLRLKEWQAFQIATRRLFVNVALFDAKVMALRQVKIYDRQTGTKYLAEQKLLPGTLDIADQLLDSVNQHRDGRGRLAFSNRMARGRAEIEVELEATAKHPAIRGALVVRIDEGASQVVSLPFRGTHADAGRSTHADAGRATHAGGPSMYSHKGMFPVEGELTIGSETHRLTPTDALALLDDHKGYYPYVMQWEWVTSATFDARGRALGVNLTQNQCHDPAVNNENCAWIGDRIGRLPAVTFERQRARQSGERWLIRDAEGRVDVVFEPTVPGDVRVNALVVESRYRGPFGSLTGRVEPEGLEPIVIDGWFGMGEQFWLRC